MSSSSFDLRDFFPDALNDADVPVPTADEEEIIFVEVLVAATVEVLVVVFVIVFELVVVLVIVFEPEELFVLGEIFFEVDVAVDPLFMLLTIELSDEMGVIEGSAVIVSSRKFLVGDEFGDASLLTRLLSEPD